MQREQAALGDQRSSAALACVGLRPEGCLVFMCQDCHTVLGDSLGVCGEDERLGVVACLRVTEDVAVVESMLYAVNGVLKGCAYHPLHCRSCGITVGFNLYTAHKMYAALRGLFCLFKENVSCYLLKSKTVVPAHRLSFDLPSLQGRVEQVKHFLLTLTF
ncbi:hypothetical protein FKM82_016436 [Ascaphus truei]